MDILNKISNLDKNTADILKDKVRSEIKGKYTIDSAELIFNRNLLEITSPNRTILKDSFGNIFSSDEFLFRTEIYPEIAEKYKVNVIESFSILPDLIIDYSEIKRKWSYGIALVNINFLGMNQKLYFGGAFIGEKWFAIGIENPWVFGDHISLGGTFYNRFTDNPFYDFTYYRQRI